VDEHAIHWAIEHEGRLVGVTGIQQIDWINGYGTTGIILGDKSIWGRGIAREVMALRTRFLFTETTLRRLRSGYLEGNLASAKAQASAGYKKVGRWHQAYFRNGTWRDLILTEIRREDWTG
jgi:RimJ/RimL family protein N-acetyltransferase